MCLTAEIELFAGDYQYRFNKLKAACTALLFKVIESQRQGSFHQVRSTAAQQSGKKENKERQRHVYPMRHLWVEWSEDCQKKLRLISAACTNKHNSWCVSIISASAPVFFSLWKNDLRQFFQQNVKGCLSGASPPCDPRCTSAIQLFVTLYQPCRTDGLLFVRCWNSCSSVRRTSRWNHFLPDRALQGRSASTEWGHTGGKFGCGYLRRLHFQCGGAIAMLPTSSDWTTIKVADREFRSPSRPFFKEPFCTWICELNSLYWEVFQNVSVASEHHLLTSAADTF